jgi:arsenate reductase
VKTVLFVCVENTFRSVLSEALFNAGPPRGWDAESAGVHPASAINPVARDLLEEVGISLGAKVPQLASPDLVARADWVVTFGCLDECPADARGKSEDWPLPGATGKTLDELRGIRDELARRIDGLRARITTA